MGFLHNYTILLCIKKERCGNNSTKSEKERRKEMNNNTKKKKADRQSLYVTVVVILMMVTVIVAIATSLARNPGEIQDTEETTDIAMIPSDDVINNDAEDTADVFLDNDNDEESEIPEDSKAEDADTDRGEETDKKDDVSKPSVKYVAPVSGEVLREASLEVPTFSVTMEDYRTHVGVDLYCEAGSDIASCAVGTVKEIWEDPMMGTCVSVEHPEGVVSVYKNLYEEIPAGIEVGKNVECGQIIATAGESALVEIAEESHLHFEMLVNGEPVDPAEYIEFSKTPTH